MLRTSAKAIVAGAAVSALLVLAGCGGGGGDGDGGSDDGVASLSQPTTADTSGEGDDGSSSEPPTEAEVQEAALDFAQCMREHGVDMPDPEFTDGGGVGINVGGEAGELDPETMDAANEACQSIMDDVTGGFEPDPEQEAEMQERALAHAQCMRDNGIENFPDPVFENGGAMVAIGEENGIDPQSPEFQEAQEACEDSFGGPGVVGGSEGGDGGELNSSSDDQP